METREQLNAGYKVTWSLTHSNQQQNKSESDLLKE